MTNTGTTTIGYTQGQVIVVTDDQGVVPACPLLTLAPGQSMTCTAQGEVIDTSQLPGGAYRNVGTVEVRTGSVPVAIVVSDSDASHYTSASPR